MSYVAHKWASEFVCTARTINILCRTALAALIILHSMRMRPDLRFDES